MAADSSERFVLLNHLGEEFAERFRRGERRSLSECTERHPEQADRIRHLKIPDREAACFRPRTDRRRGGRNAAAHVGQ